MGDWQEDDDRTRALRSPVPTPVARDETTPRAVSRVYGKARQGSAPVRPLPGSPGSPAGPAGSAGTPPGTPPGAPSSGGKGGFRMPNVSLRPKGGGGPRRPGRWFLRILAGLLVLLLVLAVGGYFTIDSRLKRIEALGDYEGRPADTPGTNWLLVGSDSREGLTKAQRRKLATGSSVGRRTDTMMLLHIPDGDGRPTLVSLPRDSYVPIDGHGSDKLNAAYAYSDGGPKLLAKTVEQVSGLRIDNYMEIGFGGFVGIVDAIGGVEIDVKQNIKDPKAGINLKKGVQTLDGGTALGYVRTRATGAVPDFDRTQRQRQFFSAVVKKAASPGVLLNPFTSVPLAFSATDSVAVGTETGSFDLLSLALAMGDNPVTTVVPIGSLPTINGQSVVKWDREKALRMFRALAEDKPVPKDVLAK
ncbi:LCP family protein [Planomonospora sp. ID91781]|uniref:LCP family protein n=1 Tax=Planomonospora sp. ID91781 TaxID=2738135 RepID=UPI0027DBCC5F|nr:LCP family protein [Planomonospora sp. ID91781]